MTKENLPGTLNTDKGEDFFWYYEGELYSFRNIYSQD